MGRRDKQFCPKGHDTFIAGRTIGRTCKRCNAERGYERWKSNSDYQRNYEYLKRYGISLKKYDEMIIAQNHRCAMCQKHISELTKLLAVDHNHTTGKVRALLCSRCNIRLGLFEDKLFKSMCEEYLNKFDKDIVWH